jgi:hypothetical protein
MCRACLIDSDVALVQPWIPTVGRFGQNVNAWIVKCGNGTQEFQGINFHGSFESRRYESE